MWAFPAFEQGALAPLVFLPATFSIWVLPGDKLFQSRIVRADCTLAPVTHAFEGSKLRVGHVKKNRRATSAFGGCDAFFCSQANWFM